MSSGAGSDGYGWYGIRDLAGGVRLLWEPHVHPFARCNIWHIRGRDRDLLIDSGTGLAPLAPSVCASGHPLIAIATHGHFDHVGGLHEFAQRGAHEAEAAQFATMPESLTLAQLFRELPEPVTRPPHAGWSCADYQVAPAPVGTPLADGDRVDLGDRVLRVLHLPGHSPGSIGLFEEHTGTLYSGDALYDGELIDDFPTSDIGHYLVTMERLRELRVSVVHGGHGPSFDERRKQVLIGEYLQGRRRQGCPAGA